MITDTVTNIFYYLTLLGNIFIILLLLLLVFRKKSNNKIIIILKNNGLVFSLIVSFLAVAGSLFFSEYAHYLPCKLCWFQRIFMYPQLLLYLIAYWVKDKSVRIYGLFMSTFGSLFAVYQYLSHAWK